MANEPTFKSLDQLFSVPRKQALIEEQTYAEPQTDISVLVADVKSALARLEAAIVTPQTQVPTPLATPVYNTQTSTPTEKPFRINPAAIDGVFDGQCMIDDEGTRHEVPTNYASKSRLLEGDMLRLHRGRYKQTHRVDRKSITGRIKEITSEYGIATCGEGNQYKVLLAPLQFHKLKEGSSVNLEIAATEGSVWAAVAAPERAWYTNLSP